MKIYLALFRGINIGGRHLLPMNELIQILQSLGCEQVETYLQSGNALFAARTKPTRMFAERIGAAIHERFGFTPKVLLLEAAELAEAIAHNPFKTEDGKALHLLFLEAVPESPDLDKMRILKSASEDFLLSNRFFYLYTPEGVGRSRLAARVESALGVAATGRNWNTIRKLHAMMQKAQNGK